MEPTPDTPFGQLDGEAQLAECIRVLGAGGASALERLLAEAPGTAGVLRSQLSTLERLGMLAVDTDEALTSIGPYRLERTLGSGAMSRVFLAHHEVTGLPVALKVLTTPLLGDDRASQRFEREVRAVSALSHPCVVTVIESGQTEGRPWLAMEYVAGATLEEVLNGLREGGVGFDELDGAHVRGVASREEGEAEHQGPSRGYVESICRIILDVALGLEHAHGLGIVHRDVKPGNIAVTLDGRAKLLDLGLARLEGSPSLTRTGDFAGTPYYVAPEQARAAKDADARSDIFSLGVTLYEALTLKRPFEGRDAAQVFRNLQTQEPTAPGRINPLLPRDLETICLRALEKDPEQRYQSMGEFCADLQRLLEFKPVHAKPVHALRRGLRWARRHPTWSLLGTVALIFLIGVPIAQARVNRAIVRERDVARANAMEAARQADMSRAVVDHLVELFSPPSGQVEGWGFEDMLAASITRIPSELNGDPLLRAALLEAAGRIHSDLNRSKTAVPLLDQAYDLRRRQAEKHSPSLASTLVWLANAHLDAGNPAAARSLADRGVETLLGSGGELSDPACFDLRMTRARAAQSLGDVDTARDELLRLCIQSELPDSSLRGEAIAVHVALAELELEAGAWELAADHCAAALEPLLEAWVPDGPRIRSALMLRSRIQQAQGDGSGASQTGARIESHDSAYREARDGMPGEQWLAEYPFELLPVWTAAYEESFQAGITGLQTRDAESAIAAFEACLMLCPGHPVCLYNLACAHVLNQDTEAAFGCLVKAKEQAYGVLQGHLKTLEQDPDLALLRRDPRFAVLRDEIVERHHVALARAAQFRSFVPTVAPAQGLSLVAVLSGDGVAGGEQRFEYWKQLAAENGWALIFLEGPLAGQRSAWIAEFDNFLENPWQVEEQPARAIAAFAREHSVSRALLVGEGSGAAVAFDLALRAPGFFDGALLLDGLAVPSSHSNDLTMARACRLKVQLLLGETLDLDGACGDHSNAGVAERLGQWLRAGGLEARAESVPGHALKLSEERLTGTIRNLLDLDS